MVAPTMIKEHMEVLGVDGVHVGTVDQLEGRDQVKLTKDDPDAGGEHHFIPLAWVDHGPGCDALASSQHRVHQNRDFRTTKFNLRLKLALSGHRALRCEVQCNPGTTVAST